MYKEITYFYVIDSSTKRKLLSACHFHFIFVIWMHKYSKEYKNIFLLNMFVKLIYGGDKMAEKGIQIDFNDDEIKVLIDILRFTENSCPVDTISDQSEITTDKIDELITKLENALEAP